MHPLRGGPKGSWLDQGYWLDRTIVLRPGGRRFTPSRISPCRTTSALTPYSSAMAASDMPCEYSSTGWQAWLSSSFLVLRLVLTPRRRVASTEMGHHSCAVYLDLSRQLAHTRSGRVRGNELINLVRFQSPLTPHRHLGLRRKRHGIGRWTDPARFERRSTASSRMRIILIPN